MPKATDKAQCNAVLNNTWLAKYQANMVFFLSKIKNYNYNAVLHTVFSPNERAS